MQRSIEQCYAIKLCVGLVKWAVETLAVIQKVLGSESLSKAVVLRKSKAKAMLIVFFDSKGVVQHKFASEGQTFTGAFYMEVLKRLKERINRVRPGIADNWKLHHSNAPSHTCFIFIEYLARNSTIMLS